MPFENTYNEYRLLRQLANNSEDAFRAIFYHYKDIIYRIALQYIKTPVLGEEIVQDVFMKVWFHRHKLEQIDNFKGWLFTVSRNCILNYLQKITREASAMQRIAENKVAHENNGDFKLQESLYGKLLNEAVEALPNQQQQVFKLARNEHLSYNDISEKLGISVMTVKTHMGRALNFIRHYLRKNGDLFIAAMLLAEKI